jgi:hypothetical protein
MKEVAHRLVQFIIIPILKHIFVWMAACLFSGLGMRITLQSRNEFPYDRAGHCRLRQTEGRFATAPEQRRAGVRPDRRLDAPRFSGRAGMVGFRLSCFPQPSGPVSQLSIALSACPVRLTCD